jgi:hypothetical protein
MMAIDDRWFIVFDSGFARIENHFLRLPPH